MKLKPIILCLFWIFLLPNMIENIKIILNQIVTESQTASSFLQLLTNALHDQHQVYNFISQNKTIMAAPVRNGFLNKCYIN